MDADPKEKPQEKDKDTTNNIIKLQINWDLPIGFSLDKPKKDFKTHFPALVSKVHAGRQAALHGVKKGMHVHELNGKVVRDKNLTWVQKTIKHYKSKRLELTLTFMTGKPQPGQVNDTAPIETKSKLPTTTKSDSTKSSKEEEWTVQKHILNESAPPIIKKKSKKNNNNKKKRTALAPSARSSKIPRRPKRNEKKPETDSPRKKKQRQTPADMKHISRLHKKQTPTSRSQKKVPVFDRVQRVDKRTRSPLSNGYGRNSPSPPPRKRSPSPKRMNRKDLEKSIDRLYRPPPNKTRVRNQIKSPEQNLNLHTSESLHLAVTGKEKRKRKKKIDMKRLERLAEPRPHQSRNGYGRKRSPTSSKKSNSDSEEEDQLPSKEELARRKGLEARLRHEREHLRKLEQMEFEKEQDRLAFRKRKNRRNKNSKHQPPDMERIGNLSKPRVNFTMLHAREAMEEENSEKTVISKEKAMEASKRLYNIAEQRRINLQKAKEAHDHFQQEEFEAHCTFSPKIIRTWVPPPPVFKAVNISGKSTKKKRTNPQKLKTGEVTIHVNRQGKQYE